MNFLLILGVVIFVIVGLRKPSAARSDREPFNRP